MLFNENIGLQLYVDNVEIEKKFWEEVGFEILEESKIMEYSYFTMRINSKSTVLFTVYDKEFISKVSPEVIELKPSILFESYDIFNLQKRIEKLTDTCSKINEIPFLNFNFASPSGIYFAVKGIE